MNKPLMPMATAVWLVEHTGLSFRQIAEFCGLHELEVQGIADETVGQNVVGIDPTTTGQLTHEEIERCEKDPKLSLSLIVDEVPAKQRTKGPRYTPVSRRQDKPAAIAWLLRNHAEISDGQIQRLIGTTKPTITAIRDRTHWNIQNIQPQDPVGLGLCSQAELDEAVRIGHEREARKAKKVKKTAKKQKKSPKAELAAVPSPTSAAADSRDSDAGGVSADEEE